MASREGEVTSKRSADGRGEGAGWRQASLVARALPTPICRGQQERWLAGSKPWKTLGDPPCGAVALAPPIDIPAIGWLGGRGKPRDSAIVPIAGPAPELPRCPAEWVVV